MKKIFILIFVALVATSCNTNNNNSQKKELNNTTTKSITSTWKTNNLKTNTQTNMAKKEIAQKWDTVEVTYTWSFEDGKIFDASSKHWNKPLEFKVWAGQMIPGFDKAVEWMKVWETKKVTLTPDEAYGKIDPNKKQTITVTQADRENLKKAWYEIKVWDKLPTRMWEVKILAVDGDKVTIDTNHPLAGKTLIFDITLDSVK